MMATHTFYSPRRGAARRPARNSPCACPAVTLRAALVRTCPSRAGLRWTTPTPAVWWRPVWQPKLAGCHQHPPAPSLRWPWGVMDGGARAFQALAPAQSLPTEKPAAQPLLALCENLRRVSNGQVFAWPGAVVTP